MNYSATPRRHLALLAALTGLLGFLLAILSAVLPVKQTLATVDWIQTDQPTGVTAPLVSYVPQDLNITLPCTSARTIPPNTVIFSTIPTQSADAGKEGLQILRTPNGAGIDSLTVTSKNHLLLSLPITALDNQPPGCTLLVDTTSNPGADQPSVTAHFDHLIAPPGTTVDTLVSGEHATDSTTRPQVVGFFTDVPQQLPVPGLTASMTVDTRFSSSPTPLKTALMVIGVLASLASLIVLWRIDRFSRRYRHDHNDDTGSDAATPPRRWSWKNRPARGILITDTIITSLLILWHLFGANTSDDGYLLNMARVADNAGYIANYFRWLGSPESPIGWYYSILQTLTTISTASPFIRIPTLLAGIISWFIISRSLLPRIGRALTYNTTAYWIAGMLFLACWMPYNNGLRPEPIEAVLFLACWALVERAISTQALLPGALAILAAAFAVGAGPTGIMCLAILFAGFRNYWQNIRTAVHTLRQSGNHAVTALLGVLSPLLASGFLILYTVFADQTLASMKEAIRVRTQIGPNLGWFEDKARWIALFGVTPDGSVTRRFPVFIMLMLLGIILYIIARRRPIDGLSTPVLTRVAGITVGSLLLLSLTPTKWTHHFGTFVGIVAVVGAVGAVLMTNKGIALARNRWLAAATTLGVTALAFTANNDWWYVSQFGIYTKSGDQAFPTLLGKALSTWLLLLALACLLVAALLHFFPSLQQRLNTGTNPTLRRITTTHNTPIVLGITTTAVVFFSLFSLLGAFIQRYPAYTVGSANLRALTGHTCSLADQVLVEPNPGQWILTPLTTTPDTALGGTLQDGFQPGALPGQIDDNQTERYTGDALKTPDRQNWAIPPFGLPHNVPILGTYSPHNQVAAHLVSDWYQLPAQRDDSPLVVISLAGSLPADAVHVDYTTDGHHVAGTVTPMDPGPTPTWRNLRLRRPYDIPANTTAIRITVNDTDLGPDKWIAVTPPRAPQLRTLQQVVGSTDPVLIDWSVGLAFPCQRPFAHRNGIAELPKWRILPNSINVESANTWEDRFGGGPLGWTDLLFYAQTVPTYLDHDWMQDWGSLQLFIPRDPAATPATVTDSTETVSGLYTPGRMRDTPPAPKRR